MHMSVEKGNGTTLDTNMFWFCLNRRVTIVETPSVHRIFLNFRVNPLLVQPFHIIKAVILFNCPTTKFRTDGVPTNFYRFSVLKLFPLAPTHITLQPVMRRRGEA
jgi:hypothetical protein